MQSQAWKLSVADVKKVATNALVFLAPVAITELTLLQQGVTDPHMYTVAFEVWAMGVALDFFRKLKAGE